MSPQASELRYEHLGSAETGLIVPLAASNSIVEVVGAS